MKPEKPATGILKQGDFGDAVWYQVACDCTDSDHAHMIEIEADESYVTVHVYVDATTPWWSMSRWKQIWQILTTGRAEMQAVALLKPQQAVNYAHALKSGAKQVMAMRQKSNSK